MPTPPELPLWLSIALAVFLLAGSLFTFIGAFGLASFRNFYDRLHMPSLATTIGAACLLTATALYSSYRAGAPVLRDALILFFLSLAAPLSLMMLSRAAAMRDFTKSWRDTSDNMFWRLAREDKETTQTDEEVEAESARQTAAAEKAEEREQRQAITAAKQEKTEAAEIAAETNKGEIKADLKKPRRAVKTEKTPQAAKTAAKPAPKPRKKPAKTKQSQ